MGYETIAIVHATLSCFAPFASFAPRTLAGAPMSASCSSQTISGRYRSDISTPNYIRPLDLPGTTVRGWAPLRGKVAGTGYDVEAEFYDYVWDSLKVDVEFYRRRLRGARTILDCMCGTGRVALALARAGFRVDGIDSSSEMLRRARRKARREPLAVRGRLHWQRGDLVHARLGKDHDAAIIAVNSYGLILSSRNRIRALQRIHSALRPGGKVLLALDSVRSYRRIRDGIPFPAGSCRLSRHGAFYIRVMAESGSTAPQVRSSTLHLVFARSGKLLRSRLSETATAVLSPAMVKSELRRAGFRSPRLFGDYDGRPPSANGDRFIIESVAG